MDREVRPKHKAPWLRKYNQDEKHQARAAKASARRRKRKSTKWGSHQRYKRTKGRPTHRRVAEKVIGRKLSSDEIVHHVDENPHNNDPSNLTIGITRRYHRLIHAWLVRNGDRITVMSLRRRKGMVPGLKYKFKTKPYRHQVKALKKLIFRRGGGLFMEMGTGKTKVALDFCGAMHVKAGVDRVVIVCPKSVISVWRLEIKKHVPNKVLEKVKFVVINYDMLPDQDRKGTTYIGKEHVLTKFLDRGSKGKSILIADESHLMKNPSAQRAKSMYRMGKHADYKLILTGTPLTKNVLDEYQQFKFLDERIFGTNFRHFKARYCVFGGYGNYKLLRYINLHEFKEKTKPYIFQVKKKDCLDLPSRTDQIVPIKLTGDAQRLYKEMAKEGLVTVSGEYVEAEIVLTKILRLQQISSGFLKVDGEYVFFGEDKRKQLDADLKQMREQDIEKVVIACQFVPDLKQCGEVAKAHGFKPIFFHGGVSNPDREARLCEFDESKKPLAFIMQNDAGSMGISLTAASNCIHFSHTRKHATDEQIKGRLHRIGQHWPVTHRHYIAPGVDQAIWMSNRAKKNVADLIHSRPELLMEEGYK